MVKKLTKESFREKIFDYSVNKEWKYISKNSNFYII